MAFDPSTATLDADEPSGRFDPSTATLSDVDAPKASGAFRRAADYGISALKGAISVPEALVGLADIPTGGRAGKLAEEAGFRPKEAKAFLDEYYSPEQKEAFQKVKEAKGFFGTLGEAVRRPSTIAHAVTESLPAMGAGGVFARGLTAAKVAAPWVAGAIGEGTVGAGMAAEQIRQQSPTGAITPGQAGTALASGAGTAAFGALGGKFAGSKIGQRLGIADVDTLMAEGLKKGLPADAVKRGIIGRVLGGAVSEGVLEELPQSMQEQIWQNVATGRPWDEGVPESGAMGMLAGAAMGGAGSGFFGGRASTEQPPPETQPVEPIVEHPAAEQPPADAGIDFTPTSPADLSPAETPAQMPPAIGMEGIDYIPPGAAVHSDPATGQETVINPADGPLSAAAAMAVNQQQRGMMPFAEDSAIRWAERLNSIGGRQHTVIPHPTVPGKFAVVPQELADLRASEHRDQQFLLAQQQVDRRKQEDLQRIQEDETEARGKTPDQQVAAAQIATDETPSAMALAFAKAKQKKGKVDARLQPANTDALGTAQGDQGPGADIPGSGNVADVSPDAGAPTLREVAGELGEGGQPPVVVPAVLPDETLGESNGTKTAETIPQQAEQQKAPAAAVETGPETPKAAETPRAEAAPEAEKPAAEGNQPTFTTRDDGSVAVTGYTQAKIRETADKLKVRVIVGKNGNAIFTKGTDLAALKTALGVEQEVDVKENKRARPASDSLLQAIINRGGISTSMKLDLLGDDKAKARPGLFTTNGIADMGEMAQRLVEEDGFSQIDLADDTDNQGAKQLADLIRRAVGGEQILTERAAEEAQAKDSEAQYRDGIRQQAKQHGINTVGKPFSKLEAEVIALRENRHQEAVNSLDDEQQAVYEAILDEAYRVLGDEAVTNDLQRLGDLYKNDSHVTYLKGAIPYFRGLLDEAQSRDDGQTEQLAEGATGEDQEPGSREAGAGSDEEASGGTFGLRQEAGSYDLLAGYSEQELAERAERIAAAEKEAAKLEAELAKQQAALNKSTGTARNPKADQNDLFNDQGSLFQRARKYDTQTLDIFTSQLPTATGARPDPATAATTERARLGATLAAYVRGRAGSLLGLAFTADWIVGRGSALVGKTVASPADLATLASVLRDPRVETFRYFLMKGKRIVHHEAVSSRMYDSTAAWTGGDAGAAAFLGDIRAKMERLGADGYYLMHNHPSTIMKPSGGDMRVTVYIDGQIPGFKGHIILDHGQFVLLKRVSGGLSAEVLALPDITGEDPVRKGMPHPVLGEIISGPDSFASIADRVRDPSNVILVATDAQLKVVAVSSVPEVIIRKGGFGAVYAIARLRKAAGSNAVFAVLPEGMAMRDVPRVLYRSGWFMDAAAAGVNDAPLTAAAQGVANGDFLKRRDKAGRAGVIEQPSKGYATGDLFADMSAVEREEIAKAKQKNSPQMDMFAALDKNQEKRSTTPVAESQARAVSDSRDGDVATARDGAAPDLTLRLKPVDSDRNEINLIEKPRAGFLTTDSTKLTARDADGVLWYEVGSYPNRGEKEFARVPASRLTQQPKVASEAAKDEKVGAGDTAEGGNQEAATKGNKLLFSKQAGPRDLIIQHNLSAENLLHALKMGGIPVPSLAVTRKEHPMTSFGEITLIGSSEMADPKGYAGTKVFGADIYSPRYPTISYRLDAAALAKLNTLLEGYRGEGRQIYGSEITRIDDLTSVDAFKKYADAKIGENAPWSKLQDLAQNLLDEVGAKERIFQGYTNSGNRRYIDHTIENVVKILKKELRGGENFNYGVGSIRSAFTPQFKSIEQIRKAKDRLMDKAAFENVKKEIDDEFAALWSSLANFHSYGDQMGFGDTVSQMMYDAAKMGVPRSLKENGFSEVPDDIQKNIAEFLAKLRTLPTEYFEAKILRDVDLAEFSGAVVPEGVDPKVIEALQSRGIKDIRSYRKGDEDDRRAKIGAFEHLMFSRSQSPLGNPHTADTLRAALGKAINPKLIASLEKTGKIKLERNWDATAIEGMEDYQADANGRPLAFFNPADGTSYFLYENIPDTATSEELAGLLKHEIGVHALHLGRSDKEFQNILKSLDLMRRAGNKQVREAFKRAEDAGTTAENMAEESLGYMIEAHPEATISQRFLAWFKQQINKVLGIARIHWKYSPADLNAMSQAALKRAPEFDASNRIPGSGKLFHRAFHGGPRDFDEFSTEHIGSGEGAQAYGWGLYFAGQREVADFYRKKLSGIAIYIDGERLSQAWGPTSSAEAVAQAHARGRLLDALKYDQKSDVDSVISKAEQLAKEADKLVREYNDPAGSRREAMIAEVLRDLSQAAKDGRVETRKGRLYQVDLAPTEDEYLDWDKPLSEQSEKVRDSLRSVGFDVESRSADHGQDVYLALAVKLGEDLRGPLNTGSGGIIDNQEGASRLLKSNGIPGIRYRDGSSRNKSEGEVHHNYVIFDEKDVTITAKFSRSKIIGDSGKATTADSDDLSKSLIDDLIYRLQDKNIDLKRKQEAIRAKSGEIKDEINAYQKEELFHGRTAERINAFLEGDLNPLLTEMRMRGVEQEDLGKYLWARHAEEANLHIAKINPDLPDGGSGMTTQEANDYLSGLSVEKHRAYEALAKRVDAITEGTRDLLEEYGLISADDRKAWEKYKFYVPLYREDMDTMLHGTGTGQGYSIRGKEAKRRTGSALPVTDILGNIANQRDKAVVRGEKNQVAKALYGLVKENPNPDFWRADLPPKIKTVEAVGGQDKVVERTDPLYKSRDNVVVVKLKSEDGAVVEHAIIFNERDERAMRMARAIKNLDGAQLGELLGTAAKITRYFAAINTQYNPIFGILNLTRDVHGAMLNLTNTPLAGKQLQVLNDTRKILSGAMKHSMREFDGDWKTMAEEFGMEGGKTGYRDMFRTGAERSEDLQQALDPAWWTKTTWGKVITANGYLKDPAVMLADKGVKPVLEWLSAYNNTMENAVRLAAYKAAKDAGLSKSQAASLAKNLTVNFNRKGEMALQTGALYAFFNASVQGMARMADTFRGPAGKRIVAGGVLLGALQAMLLAAAGFDDDEPPDFVRERNLIIPLGGKQYTTIPMPLGFNVLPNVGRLTMETILGGGRDIGKKMNSLLGVLVDATNPLGGSAPVAQIISPTITDPLVALAMNKDWTGKPIAKEDFNALSPTPGFTRARDTASAPARWLAEAINTMTGGTKYTKGIASPTPDQIEYLIGQVTGGVGRELGKLTTTATAVATGEDLPPYKIPLAGRFYGDAEGKAAQGGQFYENLKRINEHEATVKGLRKDGRGAEVMGYLKDNPDARLIMLANSTERNVSELNKRKRALAEKGADRAAIKHVEEQITQQMKRLNDRAREMRG